MHIVPLSQVEPEAVEQLLDRAFGSDRRGRTAYRIRASAAAIATLSFAMIDGDDLLGSIQCWPVAFVGDDGRTRDLVMIGPVAVVPERQRDGIGRALMAATLRAARDDRLDGALMLIGDPGYYGRFFGFDSARTAAWRLPGPVERHRLLSRGGDVPDGAGALGPRIVQPA